MSRGTEVGLREHPWIALLEYHSADNEISYRCGGSLINQRYVLTAAHCLNQKNWKLKSVRLGEHNIKTTRDCEGFGPLTRLMHSQECSPLIQNLLIEEKIPHENYSATDWNYYNDIALLRLDQNVTFPDYVRPICLPTTAELQEYLYNGKHFTMAGSGETENQKMNIVKQKIRLSVVNWQRCFNKYRNYGIILSTNQICAGENFGQDSCKGDSGGALMAIHHDTERSLNWYVAGVLSIGPNRCGMGIPGGYTRVSSYVDWIVSKIEP